jgi:prepilin-type processing-associated H-X9-DG protein
MSASDRLLALKHSHRGFTLIELAMVIGTTALLCCVGFAGWQRGLLQSRNTHCLANLRSIGVASAAYSSDNDGRLPSTAHQRNSWKGSLEPYLGNRKPFKCPLDTHPRRKESYALNDFLTPSPWGARPDFSRRPNIPRPSQTMFMAETSEHFDGGDHFHFEDEEEETINEPAIGSQIATRRHALGANYLFVDGHVESLGAEAFRHRVNEPRSAFIHPDP